MCELSLMMGYRWEGCVGQRRMVGRGTYHLIRQIQSSCAQAIPSVNRCLRFCMRGYSACRARVSQCTLGAHMTAERDDLIGPPSE